MAPSWCKTVTRSENDTSCCHRYQESVYPQVSTTVHLCLPSSSAARRKTSDPTAAGRNISARPRLMFVGWSRSKRLIGDSLLVLHEPLPPSDENMILSCFVGRASSRLVFTTERRLRRRESVQPHPCLECRTSVDRGPFPTRACRRFDQI